MRKRNPLFEDLLRRSHRNLIDKASSRNIKRKEAFEIMAHVKLNKETMKMILNGLDDAGLVKKGKRGNIIIGVDKRGRRLNISL